MTQLTRDMTAGSPHFEVRTARSRKKYFVLIAKNGEVIGQSQMYVGGGVYVGIKSVMQNAQKADVVDADGGK